MYQTLLCAQLLNAENPHCLKAGALNEQHDEDEGGVVQANRLSLKHNALIFRAPDQSNKNNLGGSIYPAEDTQME